MGERVLLFFLFVAAMQHVSGQRIQYSRETGRAGLDDMVELVADVDGTHHLVCFRSNTNPVVYAFDAQLRLQAKTVIEDKTDDASELKILPVKKHYFIYNHVPGKEAHLFYRVSADGEVTSCTDAFRGLVDSFFNSTLSTVQLEVQEGNLYAMTHVYFDGLKAVKTTVVQLDDALQPSREWKLLFDFDKDRETLQQVTMAGSNLFVLKTKRDIEQGFSLELGKVPFASGEYIATHFKSGFNVFAFPGFVYNQADSSTLVYFSLRESFGTAKPFRAVFISRLNHLLRETVPPALLRSQFRDDVLTNFVSVAGARPQWLSLRTGYYFRATGPGASRGFPRGRSWPLGQPGLTPRLMDDAEVPAPLRFTQLDKNLQLASDSLVKNKKPIDVIRSSPYAQFSINNRNYLLLVQHYTARKKGLAMFVAAPDGSFPATDVPVYDKYDYLLQQLKTVDETYFILPYRNGRDIGLMKYTFTER